MVMEDNKEICVSYWSLGEKEKSPLKSHNFSTVLIQVEGLEFTLPLWYEGK